MTDLDASFAEFSEFSDRSGAGDDAVLEPAPADRVSGRGGPVRLDVSPAIVRVSAGAPAEVRVDITNTDEVIRSLAVSVLGLDASLVIIDQPVVVLFPDERTSVGLTVLLPVDYPSGTHALGVELHDASSPLPPLVAEISVVVSEQPRLQLRAEPGNVITGKRATFNGTLVNTGNATLRVALTATDPESKVEARFTPDTVTLPPGGSDVVRVDASGRRPLVGAPIARVITINARLVGANPLDDDLPLDSAVVSMVQRARLSRRLFALVGLLMTVTVMALVFTTSFKRVADATKAQEALLKQSLGVDAPAVKVKPGSLLGSVQSATGSGIEGVAMELYDVSAGPAAAVRTTVTDSTGAFGFAGVPKGTYRLKVMAAGFGALWFPDATTYDAGQDLALDAGGKLEGLDVKLVGQPATVSGSLVGDDLAGATVTVRLAGGGAVVKTMPAAADGAFTIADLPAPGTYEVLATTAKLGSEVRTVEVTPGGVVDKLTLLLRPGDGIVRGTVRDAAGVPVSGANVTITEGTLTHTTLTLSGTAESAGTFEIRELATPGTYTVTVDGAGYVTESQSVALSSQEPARTVDVVLRSSSGTLGGSVVGGDNQPIGDVTVTITGGEITRTTRTLSLANPDSPGAVGTWSVRGLPVPGTYTVTFAGTNLASQTQALELTVNQPARTDAKVTMSSAVATVRGTVRELDAAADGPSCQPDDAVVTDCPSRLAGVEITLAASNASRRTISADIPTGAFRFDNVAPGAYTLTFRRAGSTPQTLFVELKAGDDKVLPDISLERQARITGTVTTNGVPTPNVGVRAYKIADYPNVVAQVTITGADGKFELVGIDAPETYVIAFQVPAGGEVRKTVTVFLRPGEIGVTDVQF